MKSRFKRVCVFCGSSPGKSPSYQLAAIQLGQQLVGLLNVDGYYNSLLSFIDKAVDEGFIAPAARHIIVSAQTAQELMCKLEEYEPKHSGVASKLSWEMEQQLGYTSKSDIAR
ncbi:hypothetical protein JRO89_XS07G0023800 [Xanthoceras sorbifolium]|uniref:cytokinin riboside 5'-monophosphate phosphoribohydrolase n=1 Tax=Xanthoceras sorbifolium TaxID=99658 RepID=A0ABQ8HS71_9ROSI|nr:hypothetical protein JRO89_XS07G0023800 [Xanthoceras sorbifolium]